MPGQHRAGEVVKASVTRLAAVSLPMRLLLVMAVPDDLRAAAVKASHTLRPAMLAHQCEALGIVQQSRKIDQVGHGHNGPGSSARLGNLPGAANQKLATAATPSRSTTPKPNKSLAGYEPI